MRRYLKEIDFKQLKRDKTEVIVVGGGLAGLVSALELTNKGYEVLLLTKGQAKDCNTNQAQGGIAAALNQADSPKLHQKDTLAAGAGLSNSKAVKLLTHEGQVLVKKLLADGFEADRDAQGKLDLAQEGAHTVKRVLHAGGDITGQKLRSFMAEQLKDNAQLRVESNIFAIDLLTEDGTVFGLLALDNSSKEYKIYLASAIILATGGAGQLYQTTSNPKLATGDGIAMAYRAGAEVMDLEFIQFHPTVLAGTSFLISEALRGAGAKLKNPAGERFMEQYHDLAELAPRDVVTRAIYTQLDKYDADYLYLDITHRQTEFIKERFPNIYQEVLKRGIDITKELVPIKPAAHYLMGGIKTDLKGRSNLAGLFACGEVACTGVHGANRLASNSLLEALVFGHRAACGTADYLAKNSLSQKELKVLEDDVVIRADKYRNKKSGAKISVTNLRNELQDLLEVKAGVFRNESDLQLASNEYNRFLAYLEYDFADVAAFELQNLITVGYLVLQSALAREESRGAHYRVDFRVRKKEFRKHLIRQKEKVAKEEIKVEFG